MVELKRIKLTEDYVFISELFKSNGLDTPRIELLPTNGVAIYKDEVLLGSMFIYSTDSKLAWIAYPLFEYNYRLKDRKELIDKLYDYTLFVVEYLGFATVITTSSHRSVLKSLNERGFITGDEGVTQMIKNL